MMFKKTGSSAAATWALSAALSAAATACLFLLIPLMNRGSDAAVEKKPQRRIAWVSPRKTAPAPAPRAPRPPPMVRHKKPCPPKPPAPKQPSVRNAPPSARPAVASPPLRLDSSGMLNPAAGGVLLYAPPDAPSDSQGTVPAKKVENSEKPFYLPHETDTLPAPVNRVLPEYPRAAWKEGIEGFAVVRFTVDRSGKVKDMQVEDWKGSREFCAAATRALSQWTFTPGKLRGKPVAVVMRQRFVFSE